MVNQVYPLEQGDSILKGVFLKALANAKKIRGA